MRWHGMAWHGSSLYSKIIIMIVPLRWLVRTSYCASLFACGVTSRGSIHRHPRCTPLSCVALRCVARCLVFHCIALVGNNVPPDDALRPWWPAFYGATTAAAAAIARLGISAGHMTGSLHGHPHRSRSLLVQSRHQDLSGRQFEEPSVGVGGGWLFPSWSLN